MEEFEDIWEKFTRLELKCGLEMEDWKEVSLAGAILTGKIWGIDVTIPEDVPVRTGGAVVSVVVKIELVVIVIYDDDELTETLLIFKLNGFNSEVDPQIGLIEDDVVGLVIKVTAGQLA